MIPASATHCKYTESLHPMIFSAIRLPTHPVHYVLQKIKNNFEEFEEHGKRDPKIQRENPTQRT